jgi:hypothetical protein
MMDDLRTEIRQGFQRELDKFPPPVGLHSQTIHRAVAGRPPHETARRIRLGSLAASGLLLAIGIVLFLTRLYNLAAPAGTPSARPPATVQPSPSTLACVPSQVSGCLSVTPGSGPVGTVVSLDGAGCNYAGNPAYLAFENGEPANGTVGALDIPNISTDNTGHFHMTFVIPKEFHTLQGQGGGAVRPGRYIFVSQPVFCSATFNVAP